MFYAAAAEASSNIRMAFQVLHIHLGLFYTVSFINSMDYLIQLLFFLGFFCLVFLGGFFEI